MINNGADQTAQMTHILVFFYIQQHKISVANGEKVVRVSAGLRHAVALTVSGNIYCWGHAKRGQCGPSQDGMPVSHVSKPVKGEFSDSTVLVI